MQVLGRQARLISNGSFQHCGSLPAAAEPCVRGERPTAVPLLGSLPASLVGALNANPLGLAPTRPERSEGSRVISRAELNRSHAMTIKQLL
jgi:hypothetical protein